jgi:hypothetical protein
VDYFSLLDCAMHSAMTVAETEAAVDLLHAGILACRQSPSSLQQPGAVLSLAGAVTSIVKACTLQCKEQEADSAGAQGAAAASVSAELRLAVLQRVLPVVQMLRCLAGVLAALPPQAAAGPSVPDESSSSSSSSNSSSRSASSTLIGGSGATGQAQKQQQQQLVRKKKEKKIAAGCPLG